ncbi:hypothetical protein [Paenibacillus crassostreae]|nr:hypothetical protein [Paenibacillus crassostreae]
MNVITSLKDAERTVQLIDDIDGHFVRASCEMPQNSVVAHTRFRG